MKKIRILAAVIMVFALILAGCSFGTFEFSGSPSKATIKVKNASDGAYGESFEFVVGKNEKLKYTSQLDKGQVQIDFIEVFNISSPDEADNYIDGDTVDSITIGTGETVTIELPEGEYKMGVTTIGETNGKIALEYVKE